MERVITERREAGTPDEHYALSYTVGVFINERSRVAQELHTVYVHPFDGISRTVDYHRAYFRAMAFIRRVDAIRAWDAVWRVCYAD